MALRVVAIFEAIKGASALLFVFGLIVWVREDHSPNQLGAVFAWLHLDPAGTLAHRVMSAVEVLAAPTPMAVLAVTLVYAAARLVEAWGLWRSRPWAQWLAIASSAAFVPIELEEVMKHPSSLWTVLVLAINLAVIAWLLSGVRRSPRWPVAGVEP